MNAAQRRHGRKRAFVPSPLAARQMGLESTEQTMWRSVKALFAFGVMAVALSMLTGCASVGAWAPPRRGDGAVCREILPLLGLGRAYSECSARLSGIGR